VIVGDVTATTAIVWARADRPARMYVDVRSRSESRVVGPTPVGVEGDLTGQVEIGGLRPASPHTVRVWFSETGASTRSGPAASARFRTAPEPGAANAVRIAWSGDLAGQNVCRDADEGFPILRTIDEFAPDLFLGLGDMIYADNRCEKVGSYGNAQIKGDFGKAVDLEGFRAHWRYSREDPHLRALLSRTSYVAVWDDHEVVNDFGPLHDARPQPGGSSNPLLPIGLRAFLEHNPIRKGPETPGRLYRSLRWGRHVELFLLDTRQYRDANAATDDPALPKTLLGREQRSWLEASVTASDATWKVVVSSVPMSIPTGFRAEKRGRDGWANGELGTGFENELLAILRSFRDAGVRNNVWITTDVHFATGFRYVPFPESPGFRVHELVTGPLSAGLFPTEAVDPTLRPERLFFWGSSDATSFEDAKRFFNFGVLDFDASGVLTVRVVNTLGEPVHTETLRPQGDR
jgi:alkaline phosphatase D